MCKLHPFLDGVYLMCSELFYVHHSCNFLDIEGSYDCIPPLPLPHTHAHTSVPLHRMRRPIQTIWDMGLNRDALEWKYNSKEPMSIGDAPEPLTDYLDVRVIHSLVPRLLQIFDHILYFPGFSQCSVWTIAFSPGSSPTYCFGQ